MNGGIVKRMLEITNYFVEIINEIGDCVNNIKGYKCEAKKCVLFDLVNRKFHFKLAPISHMRVGCETSINAHTFHLFTSKIKRKKKLF